MSNLEQIYYTITLLHESSDNMKFLDDEITRKLFVMVVSTCACKEQDFEFMPWLKPMYEKIKASGIKVFPYRVYLSYPEVDINKMAEVLKSVVLLPRDIQHELYGYLFNKYEFWIHSYHKGEPNVVRTGQWFHTSRVYHASNYDKICDRVREIVEVEKGLNKDNPGVPAEF